MTRFAFLSALVLAVTLHARAPAQPVDLAPGFRIIEAKVDKGKLTWTEQTAVPVQKEMEAVVLMNGKQVPVKYTVTVYEVVTVAKVADLKGVTATDAAGKAIDADKLAERLKETTPVVLVSGRLPAKHRALFKDTTVFVELPPPPVPKVPVPAQPGVVPAPGGAPPVVPPPGEKKG